MKVDILSEGIVYSNKYEVFEAQLKFENHDGSMSELVRKAKFNRGDSATVLLMNQDTGKIVFVEQFRYPVYGKDPSWLLEIPAGIIDEGESPEECMIRELKEEVGIHMDSLELLTAFYPSPGACSEKMYLFMGKYNDSMKKSKGGGVDEENENLKIREFTLDEALEKIRKGEIIDGKSILAVYMYQ